MGRFIPLISLMIFLVEYLLVVNILPSMAHGSEAAPNVLLQLNIFNRRLGFELVEQGILPTIADAPAGSSSTPEPSETAEEAAEGPGIRRMGKEHLHLHRHSSDDSVAGGGLIIGGLATAIFAAVFCYIRVTRKSDTDHHMGGSSSTMTVRGSTRTDGTTSAASASTK